MGADASEADVVWPISVALLARQAVEYSLARLWQARVPGLERAPMRAQLLCLMQHIDPAIAHEAASAWGSLSGACHHHAYSLAPAAEELESWLDSVGRVVRECDRLVELRSHQTGAP